MVNNSSEGCRDSGDPPSLNRTVDGVDRRLQIHAIIFASAPNGRAFDCILEPHMAMQSKEEYIANHAADGEETTALFAEDGGIPLAVFRNYARSFKS